MTSLQTGVPIEYLVPFSGDAERRLCGALMVYRDRIKDVISEVQPTDIYLNNCRWVYEAICELFVDGHAVNFETVCNVLKDKHINGKNKLELIGGGEFITELLSTVEADEIDYWVKVIKEKSHERKIVDFISYAMSLVKNQDMPPSELQVRLEEKLTGIVPDTKTNGVSIRDSIDSIDEILDRYFESPDSISGMSTGYKKLDEISDGLRTGNVTIIYAPSSRFKSLFVTNLGYNLAIQGIPGLWFTTEMPRYQVVERLMQLQTRSNFRKLRKDGKIQSNIEAIKSHKQALASLPIFFCDSSSPEISQIRSDVHRFKRWHDIQYVIIDLVDHVFSNRFKEEMVNNQRSVMSAMKAIAKDFNIHVILVSHISKQKKEDRKSADLDVEDMIGSAAKYQDVDMAISISPYEYYMGEIVAMSRDSLAFHMATYTSIPLFLVVTKNRHGPLGSVRMKVHLSQGGIITEEVDKIE